MLAAVEESLAATTAELDVTKATLVTTQDDLYGSNKLGLATKY